MRVALFGGTGFVGAYLIEALIAVGHEPSVLVRPGSEEKLRQSTLCQVSSGDLSSKQAIADTLTGCDAVIFSVGILREIPNRGITFEILQYEALSRVADIAESQGIRRFLLISANGAKPGGTSYQDTKYRAERYVLSSNFDATVFRPSVIFGNPQGRSEIATQLYRDMIAPPIPAIGFFTGWSPIDGAILMSPVHVVDVAQALIKTIDNPKTFGKVFELGGPNVLTWSEILHRIAATAGKKKWIVPMPIGLMYLAAMFLDRLPVFPVTRSQLKMLAQGNVADPQEIESLLGQAPKPFTHDNLAYLSDT